MNSNEVRKRYVLLPVAEERLVCLQKRHRRSNEYSERHGMRKNDPEIPSGEYSGYRIPPGYP
jgi:hypothetical protein